ncbi:MAG: DUF87 domain-containing protein [Clostridia bacterium]|nr:DUF87 domain-containing protein [Clostridia bacterium]
MARLIPKKTKVKTQFFKGFTLTDILIALVALVLAALVLMNNVMGTSIKIALAIAILFIGILLFMEVSPETRLYNAVVDAFKFMFGVKKFKKGGGAKNSVASLLPYVNIMEQDYDEKRKIGIIDYKEYFGAAIEIKSIEFYMLSVARQDAYIYAIDNALKSLGSEQTAAIYKFSRPMVLDNYIYNECDKRDAVVENVKNGVTKPEEAEPRIEIIDSRISTYDAMNVDKEFPIMKDHMYLAVYSKSIRSLLSTMNFIVNTIEGNTNNVMQCKILDRKQTAIFLKNFYDSSFDEREVEEVEPKDLLNWIMPESVRFGISKTFINDKTYTTMAVADYPLSVPNAWGRNFFSVPGTRICVKFNPVPQDDAEKRLDKSIMEMEVQASKRARASVELEKETHLETLKELMAAIKQGNEVLFDTTIFITVEEEQKKLLKTQLMRTGFKRSELFGNQLQAFTNSNISKRSTFKKFERGINSTSLAAMFPFVSDAVQDEKGFYLGMNQEPVFLDFFKRDKERINSNMVVLGKSGSGKSFATKAILTNLASDNSKIFILDPEREYDVLAHNLKGKVIDVGSAKEGRINPLQIVTQLDDETEDGQSASLSSHLQFLESFFKMILDGITMDALEILNQSIKELYEKFGINSHTEIEKLKPEQFPIMQDLYNYVTEQYNKAKDEYQKNNLRIIQIYLNKFAEGGRNSTLWNGYSTITSEENFIVFNFQTLLANANNDIANAQMMVIMRWLNNEIISNKDYNAKYNTKRRIIVVIDEAHVFIDPKKDVALDFMYQLAKRIRKYEGMQIVITQNLKDFTGTPDIARKSTAIINASQYSLIFSLAPHDINDLVQLYEKAGQINEKEQDTIVSNPRGKAFLMTGAYSRTNIDILVSKGVQAMFEKERNPKPKETKKEEN